MPIGYFGFGFFGVFPGTGGAVTPPPVAPSAGVGPWAPAVWTPLIWPAVVWPGRVGGVVVVPPIAGGRDYTIALAIRDLLEATNEFERIEVGGPADNFKLRAGDNPVVLITLVSDSDENWDTRYWLHRAEFGLIFATLDNDPSGHTNNLDRLRNIAANLITSDGSLGGLCIPGFTVFTRGDYQTTPGNPERRLTATVGCAYVVPRTAGRDTTAVA